MAHRPVMLAPPLVPLVAHWRERPQRTWSVLVTVLGDAIVPRGGSVWLATLLELFAAMGIDAGAVRTAMSRLVSDGWTERRRAGRNSAYSLAERGRATFAAAAERIYAGQPPDWDGRLRLLVNPPDRAALEAAGWGQPLPGLFISPGPESDPLTLDASLSLDAARDLAARAWPLDRLGASFARFTAAFAGLPEWAAPEPLTAMVARTLLIHEYRRIVLHAPALPGELSPPTWLQARRLCAASYAALLPASETWLDTQQLPPAAGLGARFRQRITEIS